MSFPHELTIDNRAALAPPASSPQVATVQFKNHMSHEPFQEFVKQQLMKLFFAKEIISIVRLAPFIARLFLR
jgi:hypothetical protein